MKKLLSRLIKRVKFITDTYRGSVYICVYISIEKGKALF